LRNIVIIGLKWNGKNVKRRTSGYAKTWIQRHHGCHCPYCERKLTKTNATSDHLIPISEAGNNCQINLLVCCKDCNEERGTLPFIEYLKFKNPKYKDMKYIFL
jgi:5-methylcytosine-specific restriction endonuclease McrA